MSSPRNQLSIYKRSCLHQSGGGRPNEIELRIMSIDISNSTGENRAKVIVSTCESSSLCRESRTIAVDTPDIAPSSTRECSCPSRPLTTIRCAPFRRRVSFSDTTAFIETAADHRHRRATIMQDDNPTSPCHDNSRELENKSRERENFDYDIWQKDDSSVGRSDDGYSENTPRIDNYTENPCTFDNNKCQRSHSEDIDEQTIENGCRRKEWSSESDVCLAVRATENKKGEIRKIDDIVSNEDLLNHVHKDVDSVIDDEHRMRGGCGGCCCGARDNIRRSYGCCCGGFVSEPNEPCASNANAKTACIVPSRCCCRLRVCKKLAKCETPPCMTDVQSCSGSRYCGCRCEKPGQICISPPKICSSPAHSSRGRSPCAPHCLSQSPCLSRGCCSGAFECARSNSPRCRSIIGNGCCINERAKCGTDGVCCRLRLQCECLGGGLNCRRCGRKVYQAEMQIVSGVPYHSICFSCFCCRKPLESLTYQENCGEIYCKQCYVRNFGPQGYGYGVGAGVLQTPL
ncbi:Cysteine and glycine-rich protein 2 [Camponotus japonicus]